MAGLTPPNTFTQALLIGRLRWKVLRNSVSTMRGRANLVAGIIVSVVAGAGAVVLGILVGAGGYAAMRVPNYRLLSIIVWGIFLVWFALPILMAMGGNTFDFRNLLHLPLRYSTFFVVNLAYAALDPVGLTGVFWLACLGTGVLLVRPALALWVVLLLAVLASVCLLLNRVVHSWLERLLAKRRGKEIFFIVFIGVMFGLQMLGAVGERWKNELAPYARAARPALQVLPPGLTADGLAFAAQGQWTGAASALGLVAAYVLGLGFLLNVRLRALYRGEELSETVKPRVQVAAPARTGRSWLSFLPAPVEAVAEKEIRYLIRNAVMLVNLFVPIFLVAFISIQMGSGKFGFFQRSPDMVFPSAVGYTLLVSFHMFLNSFAFDGQGLQLLLVAPVRFRQILMAKNLVLSTMVTLQAVLTFALLQAFGLGIHPTAVWVTFASLPFCLLVLCTVGNLLSLYFPRRFDFGQFRQRQSGMTVLLGLLTQIVSMGIVGTIFWTARAFDRLWMAGIAYLALGAAMLQVYLLVLNYCEELVLRRRQVLTEEICQG